MDFSYVSMFPSSHVQIYLQRREILHSVEPFRLFLCLKSPSSFETVQSLESLEPRGSLASIRSLESLELLESLKLLKSLKSLGSLESLELLESLESLETLVLLKSFSTFSTLELCVSVRPLELSRFWEFSNSSFNSNNRQAMSGSVRLDAMGVVLSLSAPVSEFPAAELVEYSCSSWLWGAFANPITLPVSGVLGIWSTSSWISDAPVKSLAFCCCADRGPDRHFLILVEKNVFSRAPIGTMVRNHHWGRL